MIDMSPEMVCLLMLGGLMVAILSGFPLAIPIGAVALIVGLLAFGPSVFPLIYALYFSIIHNYILLALPLFVFMGVVMECSGITDKMYDALFMLVSGFRGGLAVITVFVGTIIAACVGVVTASIVMLTAVALPSMMKHGYDKSLASGAICAAGSLGILIPPSVMLVIYGPMARISVGKMFMAAVVPGLFLAFSYCFYITIRCLLQPELTTVVPSKERAIPFIKKIKMLSTSVVPPMFIILSVLGSIFAGIAPPTEAAALGCLAALVLAAAQRKLNWPTLNNLLLRTLNISCMAILIGAMSVAYTGVFLSSGSGEVVAKLVMATPGGRWGAFIAVMLIYFILGFFIEWIGIFFIMVPILAPMAPILGFDPLWFGMMICINLQTSFLTPPYAFAIFVIMGVAPPEFELTTAEVIRGVIPYVILVLVTLALCVAFPQIILWLPSIMIK